MQNRSNKYQQINMFFFISESLLNDLQKRLLCAVFKSIP